LYQYFLLIKVCAFYLLNKKYILLPCISLFAQRDEIIVERVLILKENMWRMLSFSDTQDE